MTSCHFLAIGPSAIRPSAIRPSAIGPNAIGPDAGSGCDFPGTALNDCGSTADGKRISGYTLMRGRVPSPTHCALPTQHSALKSD
jgi:hypothetical protein